MRRSTTSAGTDRQAAHARKRKTLCAFLIAELICALLLLGRFDTPSGPVMAAPASMTTPSAASASQTLRDGRTVRLLGLGGQRTSALLARIAAEIDDAAAAVTAFWGPDWPSEIVVVAAATPDQFAAIGGGDVHTAATTAEQIMFAPDADAMSDSALRIVLRHELFHYAARAQTAADAPRWLTEGVADFVARPATPRPHVAVATLPTDAELAGPQRDAAYDRAWLFSRFVAETYGVAALRDLYQRACGHGHADTSTALRETLDAEPQAILQRWRQWM